MQGFKLGQRGSSGAVIWWWRGLGLSLALLALLAWNLPKASAHASYERSNPPANASLPAGQLPAQVQVWFTERIEPNFSELSIFDKNGNRIDAGDSRVAPGDPKSLIISLKPGLPDGPYTVVFKNASAEDGHIVSGSFAFLVGAGELPQGASGSLPLDLVDQQGNASNENANIWSIGLRWLNYLAGAALVGALGYALLVWRPAVARARATKRMGPQLDTAYGWGLSRAQMVAWAGLLGLVVGWFGWFFYEAGAFSSQNFGQLLGIEVGPGDGPHALSDFLFSSRYGNIWLAWFVLLVILAAIWLVAVRGPGRLPGMRKLSQNLMPAEESGTGLQEAPPEETPTPVRRYARDFEARPIWWWAALLAGAGVLLTTSLNSHAAGVNGWATWLAIAGDWLHLLSTALWIGGLMAMALGLAAAIPALLPGSGDRTRLLATLIPAFSQLAILSVMTLLVTGTFNAALHLADVSQLFSSAYGISLTIKIGLLVPLLLLGAYNLLVVSPRMRAFAKSKKAGPKEGAGSIAAGALGLHFRRAVLVEVGLAVIILLVAAFLTSNAPPNTQTSSGVLDFQSEQTNLKVELAISPGTTGDNTFEARLVDKNSGQPVADAALVDLRFTMLDMDMGTPRLELKPEKAAPGRYIGQGPILSMSGNWEATLLIQRNGQDDVNVPVKFKIK